MEMDDENIFFLDESGFSLYTRRDKGWSYKGSKANVVVPAIRSRNISTVAAISKSGLLYFETKYAAYNAASFDKFLTNFFQFLVTKGINRAVIIMDNVSFHKTQAIQQKIHDSGHLHHYLPPYAPFLNPIENIFSIWKQSVKTPRVNSTDELEHRIRLAAERITAKQISSCFRNTKKYLVKCRDQEEIEN